MPKRLIVCADGTWGHERKRTTSNVHKMYEALDQNDEQAVEYFRGVGTSGFIDKWVGGATGLGIAKNVLDAYRYLVDNYNAGDGIYLFGFSRGAYTVRSAAGMIRNCGLLKREHRQRWRRAFWIYRGRGGSADTSDAIEFRTKYSHYPAPIRFIGVWDTVGALGVPFSPIRALTSWWFNFHDVALSRSVERAYHAVSVDEKRRTFRPTLWLQHPEPRNQKMEQVWFAGCHSDVGGGETDSGLSDVTLEWMVAKAKDAGLTFKADADAPQPNRQGDLHESRNFPYTIVDEHFRAMGVAERSEESVHDAVKERYEDKKEYEPVNLIDYLRRKGLAWIKRRAP